MVAEDKVFKVDDMVSPPTLTEMVAAGNMFKIVCFYPTNFALFDIMPVDCETDDLFRLNEEICEANPAMLTAPPEKQSIVLAPKAGKEQLNRCLVHKITKRGTLAHVFFIDRGGYEVIAVSKLRQVNEEIMKYPRLCYTVVLEDVFMASNFILWSEYRVKLNKLRKTEFFVEIVTAADNPPKFDKVKMMYRISGKLYHLRDYIKALETWEWEQFSKLRGSDDWICENGAFGTAQRNPLREVFPVQQSLPVNQSFSAAVSRVLPDDEDPTLANVNLILLNEEKHFNCFNVLHHQIQKYTRHIRPSRFHPSVTESLLIKLKNRERLHELLKSATGKWLRAIRVREDLIYLFDLDEYVPYTLLEEGRDYVIRRAYPEFFSIPNLVMVTKVKNRDGAIISFEEAEATFTPGKRFMFTITKQQDANAEHALALYEVTYSAAKEREEELTIDSFLVRHDNPQP